MGNARMVCQIYIVLTSKVELVYARMASFLLCLFPLRMKALSWLGPMMCIVLKKGMRPKFNTKIICFCRCGYFRKAQENYSRGGFVVM
jgi:hypothetical protein